MRQHLKTAIPMMAVMATAWLSGDKAKAQYSYYPPAQPHYTQPPQYCPPPTYPPPTCPPPTYWQQPTTYPPPTYWQQPTTCPPPNWGYPSQPTQRQNGLIQVDYNPNNGRWGVGFRY